MCSLELLFLQWRVLPDEHVHQKRVKIKENLVITAAFEKNPEESPRRLKIRGRDLHTNEDCPIRGSVGGREQMSLTDESAVKFTFMAFGRVIVINLKARKNGGKKSLKSYVS